MRAGMASLPVEILFGVYLGLLVGIIPALISWALGFIFKYARGREWRRSPVRELILPATGP